MKRVKWEHVLFFGLGCLLALMWALSIKTNNWALPSFVTMYVVVRLWGPA